MNYLQDELEELIKSRNDITEFIHQTAGNALWYSDLKNPENEWMNREFWAKIGITPDQTHTTPVWQFRMHPADLRSALENLRMHRENPNHPFDLLVRYNLENGSTLYMRCHGMAIRNKNGEAVRMLGTLTDISNENDKKLYADVTAVFQPTIESFRDILIFSIDKEYRYLVFNAAFKSATFNAYGTEVRKNISMLDTITIPGDRAKAKTNCDRAFAGEAHITTEAYGEKQKFYFETRYNPILNSKNEITGVSVMSINVTQRMQSEEELFALNKEFESFTYSVSHDLRSPLMAINANSAILMQEYSQNLQAEPRRCVESVFRNSLKMGNLIDDLLTFSRLGRRHVERVPVEMEKMVASIIQEFCAENLVKESIFSIGPLPPACGDKTLIKQVWINLLSNAHKYSQNNPLPSIEVGSSITRNEITYFVKDNGVGFDMKYYDKLFGVFQRLHNESEFEGTGVGLAIAKRIIARHGGEMWAQSKPNEGACFHFTIPNAH